MSYVTHACTVHQLHVLCGMPSVELPRAGRTPLLMYTAIYFSTSYTTRMYMHGACLRINMLQALGEMAVVASLLHGDNALMLPCV
jgi:hypothetical protein